MSKDAWIKKRVASIREQAHRHLRSRYTMAGRHAVLDRLKYLRDRKGIEITARVLRVYAPLLSQVKVSDLGSLMFDIDCELQSMMTEDEG